MYIHWFHEIDNDMNGLVGGKGANLGRMAREGYQREIPPYPSSD